MDKLIQKVLRGSGVEVERVRAKRLPLGQRFLRRDDFRMLRQDAEVYRDPTGGVLHIAVVAPHGAILFTQTESCFRTAQVVSGNRSLGYVPAVDAPRLARLFSQGYAIQCSDYESATWDAFLREEWKGIAE
jgi:hypothetical protein